MAPAPIGERFALHFGRQPDIVASAPGRVNLIGEHTDYNEGFALPMAIDRRVQVAVARRDDDRIVARSERFNETRDIDPRAPSAGMWFDYVGAVARIVREAGVQSAGCELLLDAGIPEGAGLSSSAALEVVLVRAFFGLGGLPWDPLAGAAMSHAAESVYVGVRCGIMDQLTSACGRAGYAMLMDFRARDVQHVAMPPEVTVVVMDTGVRRSLSGSEYNERRAACERATRVFRTADIHVTALRDVDYVMATSDLSERMDEVARDCARHIVVENQRPIRLRDALVHRNFGLAGELMNDSHYSLRDLYHVSSAHLDAACEVARAHPGCFGARMTGAGFGGCAVALVRTDAVSDFIAYALPRYESATYKRGEFYPVSPDDGARLERVQ